MGIPVYQRFQKELFEHFKTGELKWIVARWSPGWFDSQIGKAQHLAVFPITLQISDDLGQCATQLIDIQW
jgi:hypothetical protein